MTAYADLVGIEYGDAGAGALDCWAFAQTALRRLGVALPNWPVFVTGALPALAVRIGTACGWREAAPPARPGDLLVFYHGERPAHVGALVAPDLALHLPEGGRSQTFRLSRYRGRVAIWRGPLGGDACA